MKLHDKHFNEVEKYYRSDITSKILSYLPKEIDKAIVEVVHDTILSIKISIIDKRILELEGEVQKKTSNKVVKDRVQNSNFTYMSDDDSSLYDDVSETNDKSTSQMEPGLVQNSNFTYVSEEKNTAKLAIDPDKRQGYNFDKNKQVPYGYIKPLKTGDKELTADQGIRYIFDPESNLKVEDVSSRVKEDGGYLYENEGYLYEDLSDTKVAKDRQKTHPIVCSICTESVTIPVKLSCGHVFDLDCILRQYHTHSRQCPIDNQPIKPNAILFYPEILKGRSVTLKLTYQSPIKIKKDTRTYPYRDEFEFSHEIFPMSLSLDTPIHKIDSIIPYMTATNLFKEKAYPIYTSAKFSLKQRGVDLISASFDSDKFFNISKTHCIPGWLAAQMSS